MHVNKTGIIHQDKAPRKSLAQKAPTLISKPESNHSF